MTNVIEYLNKENPLITLTGSCNDVLCSKCPNNKSQLCADNDKVASFDNACLKEYNLKIGDEIEWLALKDMAKSRIISQGKLVSGNVTIFNKLTTSPYKKSLFSAEQGFLLSVNFC